MPSADGRISPEELAAAAALLPSSGGMQSREPEPTCDGPPESATPAEQESGISGVLEPELDEPPEFFGSLLPEVLWLPLRGRQPIWSLVAACSAFVVAFAMAFLPVVNRIGFVGPIFAAGVLAVIIAGGSVFFLSQAKHFHACFFAAFHRMKVAPGPAPREWLAPLTGTPLMLYFFIATLPLVWAARAGAGSGARALGAMWLITGLVLWPMSLFRVALSGRFNAGLEVWVSARLIWAAKRSYFDVITVASAVMILGVGAWYGLTRVVTVSGAAVGIVAALAAAPIVYTHGVLGAMMGAICRSHRVLLSEVKSLSEEEPSRG